MRAEIECKGGEESAERFIDLRYWPVLLAHIRRHEERVTEDISDPVFSSDGRIVYNVILRCMCSYLFLIPCIQLSHSQRRRLESRKRSDQRWSEGSSRTESIWCMGVVSSIVGVELASHQFAQYFVLPYQICGLYIQYFLSGDAHRRTLLALSTHITMIMLYKEEM